MRVRLTPQGRKAREGALPFRTKLVKATGLGAAEFQHLWEELVKLRTNISNSVGAEP